MNAREDSPRYSLTWCATGYRPAALLAIYVIVWTIYSVLSRTNLDLHADMVENYSWSRELQLGYFKHPPLFAWAVAAWFSVFPTTDWAYYLLSFANVALAFAGIWALIGIFDRSPRRLVAVALLTLTPFYSFSAIKFNANTMLLSVWPWLAWAGILAVRDRTTLHAVLAGVLAALAMLSKYVSAVILLTMLASSFAIPGWRQFYSSRAVLIVAAAYALVIAPHLWWLHTTGYTTFAYAESNRANDLARLVRSSFNFSVAQLLWLLPIGLTLFACVPRYVSSLRHAFRWREADASHRLYLVLSLAPFVFTLILAWLTFTRLSAPWGIPLWFAMSALLVYGGDITENAINGRRLAAILLALPVVALLIAPLVRSLDYRNADKVALEPRREVAELLQEVWRKRTSKRLLNVAGSQSYASSVTFYAADHPSELVEYEPRYAPWMTPDRLRTGGIAFVCRADDGACFAAAARFTRPAAERVAVTLSKRFLGYQGPICDVVLIIDPPQP